MKLQKETQDKIIELKDIGFSSREIARMLKIGKSTVNDIYAKYKQETELRNQAISPSSPNQAGSGPKILVLDLETAAAQVLTFGRFKQNIGQANVIKEGGWILCCAWRWLGEERTESLWLTPEEIAEGNDLTMAILLQDLLFKADAIIAHNGANFDWKVAQTRSVYHGLGALPYVKIIDTLTMAKKSLRLPSNRLDSIGEYFGLGRKIDTGGIDLWKRVQQGDEDAMLSMVEYCEQDVNLLHDIYLKLRAVGNSANFNAGLYYNDDEVHCPTCGSTDVHPTARSVQTALSVFEEFTCGSCGSIHRGRKTATTKEERSRLLSEARK